MDGVSSSFVWFFAEAFASAFFCLSWLLADEPAELALLRSRRNKSIERPHPDPVLDLRSGGYGFSLSHRGPGETWRSPGRVSRATLDRYLRTAISR